MNWPNEPNGSDTISSWCRKLLWACKSHAITDGYQIRTLPGTHGTSLELTTSARASGSVLNQYIVQEVFGDYLRCNSWNYNADGVGVAGTVDILIARPWRERQSKFDGLSINFDTDGDVYTASYSYLSPTRRVVTISGVVETQVVVPSYKTGFDIIYAMKSQEVTGVENEDDESAIMLVDINADGRAWARARIQTT